MELKNSSDCNEPTSSTSSSSFIPNDPTSSTSSNSFFSSSTVSNRSFNKAAKGHRNLFIRGTSTLMNAIVTAVFISFEIDISHQPLLIVCQLVASASLYIQWRTGRPIMFVVRGCASFAQAMVISHTIMCGRRWYFWDECVEEAWTDFRISLRILTSLALIRLVCNGISLCCQYRYPHRMFRGRGNEQLFYRGCIQATGVPINIAKSMFELTVLSSTVYERLPAEVIGNFIRAFVIIPISSASLFNQWFLTKKGATGHATSDAYERLVDPTIDCPLQRVKVTILSASGLRNADFGGMSDPFCICEVLGRPESTWETKVIDNTREPVWDESCELKAYRLHDALKFSVKDFDKQYIKCWNQRHDPLGDVTLRSHQFHPNGFDGEVMLQGPGKGKSAPKLRLRVELLDAGNNSLVLGLAEGGEKPLMGTAEDTDLRNALSTIPEQDMAQRLALVTCELPRPEGQEQTAGALSYLDIDAACHDVLVASDPKSNMLATIEKTQAGASRESTAETKTFAGTSRESTAETQPPADNSRESTVETLGPRLPNLDNFEFVDLPDSYMYVWSPKSGQLVKLLADKNKIALPCKAEIASFNQSSGNEGREILKNPFNELEQIHASFKPVQKQCVEQVDTSFESQLGFLSVDAMNAAAAGWQQDQTSCGLVAWCAPPRPSPSTAMQCVPCFKSAPANPQQQPTNFRRV